MKWFRMWTDILDDPKMNYLSAEDERRFIRLLAICAEQENEGKLEGTINDIAWRIRCKPTALKLTFDKLCKLNILKLNGNGYDVIHWGKRQYRSDDVTERVRKHRMKRSGNVSCNNIETPPETETETETETEGTITPITPLKKGGIPFKEIIDYLNQKASRNFTPTKETRGLIRARWNAGFTLEHFQYVIDTKCSKWMTDPKMCDYLRPQTLFGTKFDAYLNEKNHPLRGIVSDKTIQTIENIKRWEEKLDHEEQEKIQRVNDGNS